MPLRPLLGETYKNVEGNVHTLSQPEDIYLRVKEFIEPKLEIVTKKKKVSYKYDPNFVNELKEKSLNRDDSKETKHVRQSLTYNLDLINISSNSINIIL